MPRTTLDIDPTVLRELKRRRREEGKSLGQLASELLARELAREAPSGEPAPLEWSARPMGARVDLEDKDALDAALQDR
jgi:hypothetical protein